MNVGFLKKAMFGYVLTCLMGSTTIHATEFFVDGTCGEDTNTGETNVCGQSNGPKKTIPSAIGLASGMGGDQITVIPGVYKITSTIMVDRPLTLFCDVTEGSCVIEGGSTVSNFFTIQSRLMALRS